jgi:hypothetical protein
MKFFASLTCNVLLLSIVAHSAPPETPRTANPKTPDPQWSVRVDVLMVAMPQDKLLPLLPDLRDPRKIDAAVDQLLAAVQRKEAILTGYPSLATLDGIRSISETIFEKRYPVGFELPEGLKNKAPAPPPPASESLLINDSPAATEFETRNLGVTLEVEPHVNPRGDFIRLDLVPQRVEFLGYDSFDAKTASGQTAKINQPLFFTSKVQTSITVQNGQHSLIAVHLLTKPENYMEVFILQAWARPLK